MRIKKTSQTTTLPAQVVNTYDTSQENTYSCDYINDSDSYSTTEVKTNKRWIDGKPIYRKIIEADNVSVNTQGATIPSGITNSEKVIRIDIIAKDSSDNWYSFWHFTDLIYRNNGNILIVTDNSATFSKVYVILEYTKTTD